MAFYPQSLTDDTTGKPAVRRCPYNSWGNGSAMRVSSIGWLFDTLEETERVAGISASITHNHPEGIKGAQAVAAVIYLARTGSGKEEIKQYIEKRFGYNLNESWEHLHQTYRWDSSCQGTVPQALIAFSKARTWRVPSAWQFPWAVTAIHLPASRGQWPKHTIRKFPRL